MKGNMILTIFSIIIISLGTYGDAIGSENQPEAEKTIVFSTMWPESLSSSHEMFLIYSEAFKRLGYHYKTRKSSR